MKKEIWKDVEYGQLVDHIEINERDPEKRAKAKYVSVEHLETLDLRIKGVAAEEQPTFSRTFKKGQILFAKRRAYQKKVAVADFDGICSPHLWALESKGELLQGLLPFIMQRDAFYEYVNANSAGTMSTYLKWPALSKYQFKLPPQDEQEKILSLFLTMEKQIEQTEEQEKNLVQTKRQILRDLFSDGSAFGTVLKENDFESISFGQVAQHVSKRVEPAQTDLEIYVGLEHLDPDNLRIERQGTPADVKGTKLLIWKDDIIFGKRRAYQRKVAVSHFDGICSAHSMVLRAKEKKIDKEFLPYFMQSDAFMDRAVQISEGSLSPTIKWKVLEKQEFTIPKQAFQQKFTPVFKQFDKLIYQLRDQNSTLKKLKQKLLDEILG
ncbi:MAG: restriction endonuclease subunit S [Flavobacteriaceae bacterium]